MKLLMEIDKKVSEARLETRDVKEKVIQNTLLLKTILEKCNLAVPAPSLAVQPIYIAELEKFYTDTFPIIDKGTVVDFEKMLAQNPEKKEFFIRKFSVVGGTTENIFASRLCDALISSNGFNGLCWGGTTEKIAFKELKQIRDLMNAAMQRGFPIEQGKISALLEHTVRQKFRNADSKLQVDGAKAKGLPPPRSKYFQERKLKKKPSEKYQNVSPSENIIVLEDIQINPPS